MHSFVVVVCKPGRRMPQHVLDHLRRADTPDLCFVPSAHMFWSDDAKRVAFAGWQTITDVGQAGSYWHADDQGLTAFAGRMWPKGQMWQTGKSWAEQLASHWCTHSVVDTQQELGGIHAAVSITRAGAGRVVTDPLSIAMIYRAGTDDLVAYSTSARLAARIAADPGQEPERDPLGVAWLPFLGWMAGDRTSYVSTRVVPMGSYVEIEPAFGSRLRFSNPTPWASDLPSSEAELIDLVHDDLTASVRSVAQIPAPLRTADITGGKDSRLVLALMLQEGVTDKFAFNTSGYEESPDSVIARQIVERFQLKHTTRVPLAVGEEEFTHRLATHVFQTSGMSNAWESKGTLRVSSTLRVTGCVGEVLRTYFHGYPLLSTIEELRTEFYRRSGLRGVSIVRPDVKAELLDSLDMDLVQRPDAGGSAPQDLADSFYVRHRNRRWFGTYEELGEAGRVRPLYSLIGLQAAFALGGEKRRRESLHFAIIRKACPDLAKIAFANDGWSESLVSDLPDADDYRAAAVRIKGMGPAGTAWRSQRLLDNLDVARDLLLDESSSPHYDIIDRCAVERVLAAPERATLPMCRQLFGALTAAVWLGRHEAPQRIGETPMPAHCSQLAQGSKPPATTSRVERVLRAVGLARRP